MADKKISALDAIVTIANDDVLPIVDTSASTTKKISITQIKAQSPVQSVAGKTGSVSLDKSDVGLGNVDNTSDADKPISTATQTALNAKQATLVSGTNIKTINGDSLLGSGDITISGGGGISDGDKGDITVSASGATWTIDDEAVTEAKLSTAVQGKLAENTFTTDFTIALADGKTFGKFENGDIVPATGKTAREVILLAAQEALAPTVSLTSPTTIQFNQTAISNVLNFSYTINSLGATVASVSLEWRRNNTGSWTVLSTNTALTTFTHTLTDTAYNSQPFNYRYTVTDTSGGTLTVTRDITPTAYVAPSISISAGSTTRYLGDISSTISGSATRNSPLVDITSYAIEVSVNGGAYSQIDTNSMAAAGASYSYLHNNSALINSTSLAYRVKITDGFTTTTSGVVTVSFFYRNVLGFSSATSVSIADIEAFGNISLTNSKARTFTGVTASSTEYTYYVYAASAGDLNNVILDGTTPILGAFTKLTDVSGTNLNGANVTYRVYRSNAQGAFTSNSIQFS